MDRYDAKGKAPAKASDRKAEEFRGHQPQQRQSPDRKYEKAIEEWGPEKQSELIPGFHKLKNQVSDMSKDVKELKKTVALLASTVQEPQGFHNQGDQEHHEDPMDLDCPSVLRAGSPFSEGSTFDKAKRSPDNVNVNVKGLTVAEISLSFNRFSNIESSDRIMNTLTKVFETARKKEPTDLNEQIIILDAEVKRLMEQKRLREQENKLAEDRKSKKQRPDF